ncbi:hypothetical protein A0H81_05542 [Grifola frondosa]|uniref:Uncharacterized protein n=1 Tax=Grifola frondosa TaxID=5627 RepID=A0A1C7MCY6_GRIFR|nr:hypothetical protein A0H81_05542 [Grifola frondosa]
MKSVAVITLLVSVALAQSPALIPTGISDGCSSFLTSFNTDTSLSSCTTSLISATSDFAPGSNSTPSASAVSSALNNVCSSSAACADATIQQGRDQDLRRPLLAHALRSALCSKDDSGRYCATQIGTNASSTSTGVLSTVSEYLSVPLSSSNARRADAQSVVSLIPNVTTFANNNLIFLFLSPSLDSTQLCTSCARNVITSYVSFESSVPYGPGLSSSVLLGGQSALYTAVQSTCGASFLNGAVQAAGGLSGGILSGAAPRSISTGVGAVSVAIGAVVMALAAAF